MTSIIRQPHEILNTTYGFSVFEISGQSLVTLGGLLGGLLFLVFYSGLIEYFSDILRVPRRIAFTVAIPMLIVALAFGQGMLFPLIISYGVGFAMLSLGLAGYSIGKAVGYRRLGGTVLGFVAVGDVIAGWLMPDVAEISFLLGLIAVVLALSTLSAMHLQVSHIGPVAAAAFSPALLAVAMIASILIAPVLVRNWSLLQLGCLALPGFAGFITAVEGR